MGGGRAEGVDLLVVEVRSVGELGKEGKEEMRKAQEALTSFERISVGTSVKSRSRTRETMMPPWEWAIRTTLLTVGSVTQALMWS